MNMGSGRIKVLLSGLCLSCLMLNAGSVTAAQAEEIIVTTAKKMREDCEEKGSFAVVNTLIEGDGKQWDEVLSKVSSGDDDWIYTSAYLSIGIFDRDIIRTHWLRIAWAKALPKNPWGVLGLEELGISTVAACSMPFIYPPDGNGPGPEFIEAYVKDTLQALKTVTGPVMGPDREDCERHLKDAYERYKNRKEQFPESGN